MNMIENYDKTTQRAMRQKRPIGFTFCESKRSNRVIDISCINLLNWFSHSQVRSFALFVGF